MLSLPGLEDIVSQEELSVFDNGRYEEIVQMLSDLGYLAISAEEGKIVNGGKLRSAVKAFRKDAVKGLLISKSALDMPFPEDPKEDHEGILTYREFSVLQLLVSLDGDFTLKSIPEIRTLGIYIRVLQYRFYLLGLLEHHPDGHFTDELKLALDKLLGWLGKVGINELLELTGNLKKLIIRLKESNAFADQVVYFRFRHESSNRFDINGANDSFLGQLKKDMKRNSPGFKELKLKSTPRKFDRQFFEDRANDPDGKFVVRLLQLSQWISGYYLGQIDGELGELTFSSFLQLAQGEAESGNTNFKMNLFVGYIADDFWVVNPHYLLDDVVLSAADQQATTSTVFESFGQEYERLNDDDKETVDKNMRAAWKSMNVNFSSDLKSSAHRFRRIYYGARSLLQSFWKGLKNIFSRLKDKAIDLASGLLNQVKNFAKFIYREIREALQIFSRGMKFLFGSRKLTTTDSITRFDFDMDSITGSPEALTDSSLKEHRQLLVATTTGLTFCLKLTGRIIRLAVIASMGWHKLVLEAGIMLRKLIKECYSEKEYTGFIIDPQG
jgi:hypothetical protein